MKIVKLKKILLKIVIFTAMKHFSILHGRVFVMSIGVQLVIFCFALDFQWCCLTTNRSHVLSVESSSLLHLSN